MDYYQQTIMRRTRFPGNRHGLVCRKPKPSEVICGERMKIKPKVARLASAGDELKLLLFLAAHNVLRGRRLVEFQFYHPTARSVRLSGTLGVTPDETFPLEHLGSGAWLARLLLPYGRYEYHFLVDGERRADPLATEFRQGASGEINSVLVVE